MIMSSIHPFHVPIGVKCIKSLDSHSLDGYVSSSTPLIATEKTGKSAQWEDLNTRVNQIMLAGNRCN